MPSAYRYDVDGEMPPIMTPAEFAKATGGTLSATAETVGWALGVYSDAIRRQCGWHVAPSLACAYVADGGRLIRLPAMSVSSVESVTAGGEVIDPSCYEWSQDGLLRFVRPCAAVRAGWRGVIVRYVAGSDDRGALQSTLVALVS